MINVEHSFGYVSIEKTEKDVKDVKTIKVDLNMFIKVVELLKALKKLGVEEIKIGVGRCFYIMLDDKNAFALAGYKNEE